MYGRLMRPKYDYAFQEIMEEEKARIGFLSAVLSLNPEEVKGAILLEDSPSSRYGGVKPILLTIRLLLENQKEIDVEIEIQLSKYEELHAATDRSLFWLSKAYAKQAGQKGEEGRNRSYASICILNYRIFEGEEFHSCFHFREDTRGTSYTDQMEFHVLELPKLPEEPQGEEGEDALWGRFIRFGWDESLTEFAKRNEYFQSAFFRLLEISQDKEKWYVYEARERAIRDRIQGMKEAFEQGIREGRIEAAKKMKEAGRTEEDISRVTGLDIEEIKALGTGGREKNG